MKLRASSRLVLFVATVGCYAVAPAQDILNRGLSLLSGKKRKLGRGYLSLALHLNPFLRLNEEVRRVVASEPMDYWKGNAFLGQDKTYLEGIFGNIDRETYLLYAWRNLELSGLSCCGMDNVAVFFSQAQHHMYIIPFLHLVPGYANRLKPENQPMYQSFRNWWQNSGSRPMPDPPITYHGRGKFRWELMQVVFRANRLPDGWNELLQAVLLERLSAHYEARLCVQVALGKNPNLAESVHELISFKIPEPIVQQSVFHQTPVLVCHNPHVGLGNLAAVMVSAHALAKLTGRKLLIHWNVNTVSQYAYKVKERPDVALLETSVAETGMVVHENARNFYFFHMMDSNDLADVLEVFGCGRLQEALQDYPVVTVSSNMYFAPLVGTNPNVPSGAIPGFPQLLKGLLGPSDEAVKRALDYAKLVNWGSVKVVAIHVRAREEAEDNDDWPAADSPDQMMLANLKNCLERAVSREFADTSWSQVPDWDLYVAATTEIARSAVVQELKGTKGLRHVLQLPDLGRNRGSQHGAVDAMAEALLMSRADVFVRMVIGTSGFSTFAYLSNALREQGWAPEMPALGSRVNYLVTSSCGAGRCFLAPPDLRAASISWHGQQYTQRSCGDVVKRYERAGTYELGCRGLRDIMSGDEL